MPYIVKVANQNGAWVAVDKKFGTLAQIPPSDVANWRNAGELIYPAIDNDTQIYASPTVSISADGSTVSLSFQVETLPSWWSIETLKNKASQLSLMRRPASVMLSNGALVGTDSTSQTLILGALTGAQAGLVTLPLSISAMNGAYSFSLANLQEAYTAISGAILASYAKLNACCAAIDAGTITTGAQVDAAI